MATTEGKSKRDLIWEQKKRAREQRLQNGGADESNNTPAPDFTKKSPLYDNFPSENAVQSRPLDNYDVNRARNAPFQNDEEKISFPQPSQNKAFQAQDYAQEQRQQEIPQKFQQNFQDYEPPVGRNKFQQEEATESRKVNFNPSFQPSVEHNEPMMGRESREMFPGGGIDNRKMKKDYAEDLRNQMKQKEIAKQQEKNEIRSSYQANPSNDDAMYRVVDKRRKEQYGDFLKQQMQAKEDMKKMEKQGDRKNQLIQNLESQEYNPFGRGGAGAPLKDALMYGQRNPAPSSYNQGGYGQQQQPQLAQYIPQTNNAYQQKQMDYPPQRMPQEQMYNAPASGQSNTPLTGNNERYMPRQASFDMKAEKFPVNQLQRAGTIEERNPSRDNFDAGNNYEPIGGNERVGRRGNQFSNEDPNQLAKKEKMLNDYQRGLQEQIEHKRKMKELEKQKKLEEDRLEDERIRREQEEFERRQAEEDPKKKKANKAPVEQEMNQFVQQPRGERPNRGRVNQANEEQHQSNRPPSNQDSDRHQQHPQNYNQPPYQQYPPQNYPPNYPQYNPMHPPPYGNPYHPPYSQYPPPYGQPFGQMPPPYFNPQHPASYPSSGPSRSDIVTSEIQQIRSEFQNQQQSLNKQLEQIKKEAMNAMDGRDKAEQELRQLREKLQEKMIQDQIYQVKLQDALEKNTQTRRPPRGMENAVRVQHPPENLAFDNFQEKPKRRQQASHPTSQKELPQNFEFPSELPNYNQPPTYDIKYTEMNLHDQKNRLEESYMPYGDINRTLAGDTKMIPLDVFDNRLGNNAQRTSMNDPLTLSKIQNFEGLPFRSGRPNSSKPWNKDEDSIDALIKAHGPLRPSSSESSAMGDTSQMIGRRLHEASAILKGGDFGGTGKSGERYGLRSRENDTLNLAGRNVLGEKNFNMRGNEDLSARMYGGQGIRLNDTGNTNILPDLSMGLDHESAHNQSMNTTGMSFNVDKINLANEARLKRLESSGTGGMRGQGYDYGARGGGGNRGNYYGGGRGGLESIEEDPADNMAKIDNLLGGYLKTHEEEEQRRSGLY